MEKERTKACNRNSEMSDLQNHEGGMMTEENRELLIMKKLRAEVGLPAAG